ncbi:MAG: type II 3-dehydroquinate dehydratase [Synergistales bacterium]
MEKRLMFSVINGPNLNLLGEREPQLYGACSLQDLENLCRDWGRKKGIDIRCAQTNHEGEMIDLLHAARLDSRGVVLNAAGYTHTSVAIRDAVSAIRIPVIEVHLTNTAAREPFRRRSLLTPVAAGLVMGFGKAGYLLALEGLLALTTGEETGK